MNLFELICKQVTDKSCPGTVDAALAGQLGNELISIHMN
jgi:hypothetical protein